MEIFSLVFSFLIGVLVISLPILFLSTIVLGIRAYLSKDYRFFIKFLKIAGVVFFSIFVLVSLWGVISFFYGPLPAKAT